MKQKIVLILTVLCVAVATSQITVKGKVMAKNTNTPLEFATVIVSDPDTQKTLTGTITNEKGEFNLDVNTGIYTIKVEFIGFKIYTEENVVLDKDQILQPFFLVEDSEMLQEVTVVAEKSTTEYKLDKRIFNVGKDLISRGGSANDILNNVPSVSVDVEGVVSLRGNPSVRILINGKPSVLTNNNGLEQIPSESIEKIEVITNPSAKYDAEGTAGILNIILKKNKRGGFSSSLQFSTGYPANHGINYNANYKTEKLNVFSNFRYRYLKFLGEGSLYRTNLESNSPSSFIDQIVDFERKRKVFNLYIGSDYYFNDKNTTTFSYYHRNNTSENEVDYTFNFLNATRAIDSTIITSENYKEPQKANRIELNHVKTFDKKGQKLTLDLQYDFWNDDENEFVEERNGTTINTLQSRDIESSKDFLFQSDFKLPLGQKTHIELGLKGEVRDIDSDYKVIDNNIVIDSLHNLLQYKERIYGAYTQYGNKAHKLQYLLGVRMEHSDTKSTDRKDQFNTNKNYTDFFPTVHITYNFNQETNLQLNYSRRIRRPRFWHLNPFGGIADRRNIRVGNPDLNPMYTNSFELGMLKRNKRFTLNPSIYYQRTTQLFETQVTRNEYGAIIAKPINSGEEDRLGAELGMQFSPYQWWRLSGEVNYYTFTQKGIYDVKDNAWSTRLNSRIRLPKFNFQTSFNYRGERESGQMVIKSIYWADVAISKDFWNDKASVTMSVQNIFDSMEQRQIVTGENYTVNRSQTNRGRRFGVTFTYRFNRSKKDRDRLPD